VPAGVRQLPRLRPRSPPAAAASPPGSPLRQSPGRARPSLGRDPPHHLDRFQLAVAGEEAGGEAVVEIVVADRLALRVGDLDLEDQLPRDLVELRRGEPGAAEVVGVEQEAEVLAADRVHQGEGHVEIGDLGGRDRLEGGAEARRRGSVGEAAQAVDDLLEGSVGRILELAGRVVEGGDGADVGRSQLRRPPQ